MFCKNASHPLVYPQGHSVLYLFVQRPPKVNGAARLRTEHWLYGIGQGRERERQRETSIALDHSLGFKLSCHYYLKPIKFIYVPKQVH